jgi:hypothetical protein
MEYLHVEVSTSQLSKRAGQPSGDVVRVVRSPGWTTILCCDGMGSGIKANVAATLHASRLLELEKQGVSLRDAFARVVGTIHQDRGKTPMYAAMAVARILHSGEATVLTYDMPAPIFAGAMHASLLPQRLFHADAALLGESHCHLNDGEGLCLMSDGITQAGIGTQFRDGWGDEQAARYLDTLLGRKCAFDRVAEELTCRARQLWCESRGERQSFARPELSREGVETLSGVPSQPQRLGDDCTVVFAYCRPGKQLSILTGPPYRPTADREFVERFLATSGWKVVCGATTSKIVARHLGKELAMDQDGSLIAPPSYRIEGIDLVTEGAVTLTQVYNILEEDPSRYEEWSGVTELCDLLRAADRIHFFVGTASNPGNLSIAFQQKGILPRTRTVPLIRERLTKAGKLVVVDMA